MAGRCWPGGERRDANFFPIRDELGKPILFSPSKVVCDAKLIRCRLEQSLHIICIQHTAWPRVQPRKSTYKTYRGTLEPGFHLLPVQGPHVPLSVPFLVRIVAYHTHCLMKEYIVCVRECSPLFSRSFLSTFTPSQELYSPGRRSRRRRTPRRSCLSPERQLRV